MFCQHLVVLSVFHRYSQIVYSKVSELRACCTPFALAKNDATQMKQKLFFISSVVFDELLLFVWKFYLISFKNRLSDETLWNSTQNLCSPLQFCRFIYSVIFREKCVASLRNFQTEDIQWFRKNFRKIVESVRVTEVINNGEILKPL